MGLLETVKYRLLFSDLCSPTDQDVVYDSVAHDLSAGRKFAITHNGDLAWVPSSTKLGDCIFFLRVVRCHLSLDLPEVHSSYLVIDICTA